MAKTITAVNQGSVRTTTTVPVAGDPRLATDIEVPAQHLLDNDAHLKALVEAKEPAFTKNTAFNKNYGQTAGTVLQGDHHGAGGVLML